MKKIWSIYLLFVLLVGCSNNLNTILVNDYPSIYPDYMDICVPYNIAPLNFMVKTECEKLKVELSGKQGKMEVSGSSKIEIPISEFKELMQNNKNDTIWVSVSVLNKREWKKYKAFYWKVVPEAIDSYLTYRLIEPGYEVWSKIALAQRNISNFDETYIADNNLVEGSCMNCHIGSKQNPDKSFFHIRGPKGMTVIADGEKLRKISTKPEGAYSNMIYGNWHPSGQFIAFSTNIVLPSVHTYKDQRAFVYDTISDVVVLDIEKNEVLTNPLLSKSDWWETFPEFSADGTKLYFCSAKKVKLPEEHDKLQYSLCVLDFDPVERKFGKTVDTLVNSRLTNKTVSELKASPDGKYLLFTYFNYGTFPIWHPEAKLYNYNLKTGQIDSMPGLNNNLKYSNSYHSWSSNSRWVVFASKRDNGMYGKPYFSYIDVSGKSHKPFVMPQKDAEFYDFTYKSYNIPELFEKPRSFDALDIEELFKNNFPVERVKYRAK